MAQYSITRDYIQLWVTLLHHFYKGTRNPYVWPILIKWYSGGTCCRLIRIRKLSIRKQTTLQDERGKMRVCENGHIFDLSFRLSSVVGDVLISFYWLSFITLATFDRLSSNGYKAKPRSEAHWCGSLLKIHMFWNQFAISKSKSKINGLICIYDSRWGRLSIYYLLFRVIVEYV